jgi:hypothetical protein
MIYDLEQVKARSAVRLAKVELRRWERRYDRHRGSNPMRYVAEIKAAEDQYRKAVEALRLVRDGQPSLPRTADTVSTPRAPLFRAE